MYRRSDSDFTASSSCERSHVRKPMAWPWCTRWARAVRKCTVSRYRECHKSKAFTHGWFDRRAMNPCAGCGGANTHASKARASLRWKTRRSCCSMCSPCSVSDCQDSKARDVVRFLSRVIAPVVMWTRSAP
eukprot:scaffold59238_cov27-Tisochrysis_lutea.AAC.4